MDLHQLRCFLATAEELHFGRAALQLNLSQPAISHQIRRLEANLGVELFIRTSRQVQLTDAGQALLPRARRTLNEAEAAAQATRDAAAGIVGRLLVGTLESAMNEAMPPIVRRLHERYPGIDLRILELATAEQISQVTEGALDAGVVRSPSGLPATLDSYVLARERFLAVVPPDHPLADAPRIALEQFAGEPFILWERAMSAGVFDQTVALCQRHGFSPAIAMECNGIETQLGLVSAGLGVTIQPESYRRLIPDAVRFVEIEGEQMTSTLELIWRRGNVSSSLSRLLECASERAGGS